MNARRCPVDLRSPRWLSALVIATLLLCSGAVPAHHSFAALLTADGEEVIRVFQGSVELYKLLNPHTAIIVNVTSETGEEAGWLIEFSSSSTLIREGWTEDSLSPGDEVTIAILASRSPNRGRLRAVLVNGESRDEPARLLVGYGIRGDTPIMRRLRERLPTCGDIETRFDRSECFTVDARALSALEAEFPGPMGYVLP